MHPQYEKIVQLCVSILKSPSIYNVVGYINTTSAKGISKYLMRMPIVFVNWACVPRERINVEPHFGYDRFDILLVNIPMKADTFSIHGAFST